MTNYGGNHPHIQKAKRNKHFLARKLAETSSVVHSDKTRERESFLLIDWSVPRQTVTALTQSHSEDTETTQELLILGLPARLS